MEREKRKGAESREQRESKRLLEGSFRLSLSSVRSGVFCTGLFKIEFPIGISDEDRLTVAKIRHKKRMVIHLHTYITHYRLHYNNVRSDK